MTEGYDPQASALDAYLQRGGNNLTPSEDHPVFHRKAPFPLEEAQLAEEIRRLAQSVQPDPLFEQELERHLTQIAEQRNPSRERHNKLGCWLAASGFSIALLVGLAWVARSVLLLGALPTAAQPASPQAVVHTATPIAVAPQPTLDLAATPSPFPTSTASPVIYALAIQPELDFLLETEFPPAPAEASVYRQAGWEALTPANAAMRAAQLGVEGGVYLASPKPPGSACYLVWDGIQKVTFCGSPDSFQYEAGDPALFDPPDCAAPCLARGAEGALLDFLNGHSLLGFPAETRPSAWRAWVDQLIQTIEGYPLLYRSGECQGEALISAQGNVLSLDYNPVSLENLGSFPILSAAQAWEAATQITATRGIELLRRNAPAEGSMTWLRVYPPDEPVEIFGNLEVFQPVTNDPTLLMLKNLPLTGNITGLESASAINPFVQVLGRILEDEAGRRTLQVEGWQVSPFPFQTLSGRVERQSNGAYLNTGERAYLLPNLPEGVPGDRILTVGGVVIEQPELSLAWSVIATGESGFGGGSGSAFPDLNLEGRSGLTQGPIHAPPTPPSPGQRLEGASGRPYVLIHMYSDGSTRAEVWFYLDPAAEGQETATILLEGVGLAGIERYHNLPLRIWGSYGELQRGQLVFHLENYEPVYSQLQIQAWIGRFEPVTLENRPALLFTTLEGEKLALDAASVADLTEDLDLSPGDPVVLEGFVLPDRSLGGFPVIQRTSLHFSQGIEDLSEYTVLSGKPVVIQETGTAGAAQKAFIQNIELAYWTENPRELDLSGAAPLPYAQPVWRFSGVFEDGAEFDIIIQALAAEFLVQP